MKRHWSALLVAVAVSFLAASTAEAARVGARAWWRNGSGYWYNAGPGYNVKFCKNADGTGSCVSTTTYSELGSNNSYYVDLPYSATDQIWYWFLYNDTWAIGSASSPSWNYSNGTSLLVPGGWTTYIGMDIYTGLRPLVPTAVYPTNGASTAPTSFTLKWTSGINADRVGWPATYDIYAYGEGGTEGLIASNISCNPDGSGNCQLAISNLVPNALYHWRVVAKLNIGMYSPNPYYVNSSSEFTFTTAVDANAPVTFMTANLSNYLTAAGGGGGLLDATGTSSGTYQRFKVEDVNGGNLNSNDVVHLKMADTYYVSAENAGGGNVSVQYTSAITWEKFTVQKISGSPGSRIVNGDRISFKTYDGSHYVRAVSNGGSSVDATSTSASTSERFIYETDMN
jgi:hypothetical protein